MRILIISNYYPPFELGGWEQLTAEVTDHLRRRGHEVLVLTSRHRAGELAATEPGVIRGLHLQSPDVAYYHPAYTLRRPAWQRENSRLLRQTIADFRPDMVFINGMWNLSPAIALEVEHLCPERVVYYMASTWPTDVDPDQAYWAAPPNRRVMQPVKSIAGWMANSISSSTDGRSGLRFTRVLCVSEFIRQYLVTEAGIPAENTFVVYNGIDPRTFSMEQDDRRPSSVLRLLYSGSLVSHKGVDTAIRALDFLQDDGQLAKIKLTIVGSGHPDYETYLKKITDELDLRACVSFEPRVPREQVPALLKQHDVLLFPSVWEEPLARMVQEAMASGMVVIGSTSGGTPEILRHGENGLTFTPGDDRMLAERITLLLDNPTLFPTLSEAARQTVEECFTINRMVDELEFHFQAVLTSGRESIA